MPPIASIYLTPNGVVHIFTGQQLLPIQVDLPDHKVFESVSRLIFKFFQRDALIWRNCGGIKDIRVSACNTTGGLLLPLINSISSK